MAKEIHALTLLIPVLDVRRELPACLRQVAGLALLRRVVLMAGKSGLKNIMVVSATPVPEITATLADTPALHISCEALDIEACTNPIVVLAPDCLPDAAFFSRLKKLPAAPDQMLLWQDDQAILLGCADHQLLSAMEQAADFRQLVHAFSETSTKTGTLIRQHGHAGLSIRTDHDRTDAESVLLSGLVKATEGWMALHLNRKISLMVTRRLMRTGITPNHMTGVSMVLGLIGAACFLSPAHGMQIMGALFFLAHSILDGCDGELARLKFMESRLGGILDFWSDNIVHVSVFAAMGIGWATTSPDPFWPWLWGGLAVGGTAASASLVYWHTMRAKNTSGPLYTSVSTSADKTSIIHIADILSRRDFIYLVLALAIINQTHWFLVMTAIGAPIYALLLIAIIIRE